MPYLFRDSVGLSHATFAGLSWHLGGVVQHTRTTGHQSALCKVLWG